MQFCINIYKRWCHIINYYCLPRRGDSHEYLLFDATRIPVSSSKGQNHSYQAPIYHATYLPNGKAYELQTRYTDGGRRPASTTGAITSKVRGQGRIVTWSVWAVLAGGGIPCRPYPAATLLAIITTCINENISNILSNKPLHRGTSYSYIRRGLSAEIVPLLLLYRLRSKCNILKKSPKILKTKFRKFVSQVLCILAHSSRVQSFVAIR